MSTSLQQPHSQKVFAIQTANLLTSELSRGSPEYTYRSWQQGKLFPDDNSKVAYFQAAERLRA